MDREEIRKLIIFTGVFIISMIMYAREVIPYRGIKVFIFALFMMAILFFPYVYMRVTEKRMPYRISSFATKILGFLGVSALFIGVVRLLFGIDLLKYIQYFFDWLTT